VSGRARRLHQGLVECGELGSRCRAFCCSEKVIALQRFQNEKALDQFEGLSVGVPSTFDSLEVKVLCAGINRHEVENVRVSRERISDLLGPEFCTRRCEARSEA